MDIEVIIIEDEDQMFDMVSQFVDESRANLRSQVYITRLGGSTFSPEPEPTAYPSSPAPDTVGRITQAMREAKAKGREVLLVIDLLIIAGGHDDEWLPTSGLLTLWNAEADSIEGRTPIIIYTALESKLQKKTKSPNRQIVSKISRGALSSIEVFAKAVDTWLRELEKRAYAQ